MHLSSSREIALNWLIDSLTSSIRHSHTGGHTIKCCFVHIKLVSPWQECQGQEWQSVLLENVTINILHVIRRFNIAGPVSLTYHKYKAVGSIAVMATTLFENKEKLVILAASSGSVGEYIVIVSKKFSARFLARRHVPKCNSQYIVLGSRIHRSFNVQIFRLGL